MIPDNESPALLGAATPSVDDAVMRILDLQAASSPEAPFEEKLVHVAFLDLDQVVKAFRECGFFVDEVKKPIVNAHSRTHWLKAMARHDGTEYTLLVNVFGTAKIINCMKTGEAKTPQEPQ